MDSLEVQEDMREAANNLVKHFHKPEQEVCGSLIPSLAHRQVKKNIFCFVLLDERKLHMSLTSLFISQVFELYCIYFIPEGKLDSLVMW